MPDLSLENEIWQQHGRNTLIAGVDEVGRGPLAGNVVAAAVILPAPMPEELFPMRDSKKLSAVKREILFKIIQETCLVGVGSCTPAEIDHYNILQASLLAMQRAVSNMPLAPNYALIDGNRIPKNLPCPSQAVVKGDVKSYSIAAASIIAKVLRDQEMLTAHAKYPQYGWANNAGYPTAAHRAAIGQHGLTPLHRLTFKPCRDALSPAA